ncbi:hypothetical protein TNCV_3276421 [Trichonephila clavipes]|nr:hypothetical protein TNCV_3276421 [Trichonephila clavipes]
MLDTSRFGEEMKSADRLFKRISGMGLRSGEKGENIWRLPMRGDEGCESDSPLEFKGVDSELERGLSRLFDLPELMESLLSKF